MNQKEFQQILREAIKDGGKLENSSNKRMYALDYDTEDMKVRFAWWFTDMERFGLLIMQESTKDPIIVSSTAELQEPEQLMPAIIRSHRIMERNARKNIMV